MKVQVKAFLFMEYGYDDSYTSRRWAPSVWRVKIDNAEDRVFIREMTIDVDIPDDFDPVPAQVAALEKQKLRALAEYQQSVAEINERLSKLLAIEHQPSAVEA
jgi:hypothetical protein